MLTNGVKKEGRGQNRARRKAKRERTGGKENGSEGDGALQLHRECMCACTYCDASTHNNVRLNENVATTGRAQPDVKSRENIVIA